MELAQLEQDRAGATSEAERSAIDEQIALIQEAQKAEAEQFKMDYADRRNEMDAMRNSMVSAAQEFGKALSESIRSALAILSGGGLSLPSGGGKPGPGEPGGILGPRAGLIPAPIAAASGATYNQGMTYQIGNIDARGSTLSRSEFEKIIEDVLNRRAKSAVSRDRTR